MKYLQDIRTSHNDAERLESMYQSARRANETDVFTADIMTCYKESPDNLLYAAWYHRLQQLPHEEQAEAETRSVNWKLAVPLSVMMALIFWALSDPKLEMANRTPLLLLVWAPIAACFVTTFLSVTAGRPQKSLLPIIAVLVTAGTYAAFFTLPGKREHYQNLMALHLPLLAWIGVGVSTLGLRSEHHNRFAFLIKSIEVLITGGVFIAAGAAFVAITSGMFDVLNVDIPDTIMRLLFAGGFGLIPLLAVTTVYDPHASPAEQKFSQGPGKLIAILMWILLPLSLIVLVVYLVAIPFNFMEPFYNRQALIVYNAMLFAIMLLLLGATPVRESDVSPRQQTILRSGVLAVAILTLLVSVYALSAIVYRTVDDGLTMNRLTVIGWNSINIGILGWLIVKQLKDGSAAWIRSLQSVFSLGTNAYAAWTIFVIVAIPLIFVG